MSVTPVEPAAPVDPMEESILDSIKKALNIPADYDAFDLEITMHINSVLANLVQLGVGPVNGFAITGNTETWGQLLGEDTNLVPAKTYTYLKVRLIFDPPATPHAITAFEKIIAEQEFRLSVHRESTQWATPLDPTIPEPDHWTGEVVIDGGIID